MSNKWTSDWFTPAKWETDTSKTPEPKKIRFLCPNCQQIIEGEGFFYEFKKREYLGFCDRECLREWIKDGKDVALKL